MHLKNDTDRSHCELINKQCFDEGGQKIVQGNAYSDHSYVNVAVPLDIMHYTYAG